jgi:hypothetical protein
MDCHFTTCRFNENDKCTHEDNGAECKRVANAVLGIKENECEFCHGQKNKTVECCKIMKLKKTASETDMKDCQIFLHEKESPALMIFDRFGCGAFLEIEFCPMCGRRLRE